MTTTPADPPHRRSHHRGKYAPLQRGRPAAPVVIDYDAAPTDPPRQLRQLQRVTWWNVKTGQIEEKWG